MARLLIQFGSGARQVAATNATIQLERLPACSVLIILVHVIKCRDRSGSLLLHCILSVMFLVLIWRFDGDVSIPPTPVIQIVIISVIRENYKGGYASHSCMFGI